MSLIFDFDAGSFRLNEHAKYLDQWSFISKRLSGHKDTQTGSIVLPGPQE